MANATDDMIESQESTHSEPRDRATGMLRLLLGIAALLAILAAVSNAAADVVELRSSAQTDGEHVLLRDVADLEGPAAVSLADTVIAQRAAGVTTVTLADVRRALDGMNDVNWAKLTLRGHWRCTVTRLQQAAPVAPVQATAQPAHGGTPDAAGAAASNPVEPIDANSALTVRSLIISSLALHAGTDSSEITVLFSDSDAGVLDASIGSDRVLVEPQSRNPLGRMPLTVLRYQGEKQVGRSRLTVQVSRRMLAVVAARAIDRGATIQQDDVEVREVVVDDGRLTPMTDPRDAWGKAASASVRKDAVVCHEHVKPAVVIERGAYVTVRCISGNVVLKMVCTAMEAGSVDQMIEVRNEATRENVLVRVTGPGQAVHVIKNPDSAQANIVDSIDSTRPSVAGR